MRVHNKAMLRDPALIPLSHQHQHALALCVRIGKAFEAGGESPDVHPWELEIVTLFDQEIAYHFAAEEKHLFPMASQFEELWPLVDELRIEHTLLRRNVERARLRAFTVTDLQVFSASLSEHIRKEERHLFEALQRLTTPAQLRKSGDRMREYFVHSGIDSTACEISRNDGSKDS